MKISSRKMGLFWFICLFAWAVVPNVASAQRSTDFALLDQHGVFHQLGRYGEFEAVVLFVQGNGEESSRQALPKLQALRERYSEQGVVVLLLNPHPAQTRVSVLQEMAAAGVELPVLLDSAQVVARSLRVETTAEAFILDPKSHDVLYRGPLDNQSVAGTADSSQLIAYLENALVAILAGQEVAVLPDMPAPAGSPIDYLYVSRFGDRQISYQDEIVPILKRRCTTCHIEDGLAPWAMVSHRMVQGWSPMIREVLVTHRMPPGQIDMLEGAWDDVHQITDDELITLVHWIDSGARRDGDSDPLTEQVAVDDSWKLGEPDVIIDVPAETIPATGMVDFKIKRADLALEKDQWISAVAYNVGDRSVLHSLLVFAVDPSIDSRDLKGLVDPKNAEFISLYVPPRTEEAFAADAGFLLRQDRDLSFKLRYVTGGRETVDKTRIGLYFRDSVPKYAVRNVITLNTAFTISPGEDNHVERATTEPFEHEVLVESFAPQTHTRGKSMSIYARYPDGSEKRLINVANYNFNWQMNYKLEERLRLPAGSRLVAETVYDNSASNPQNVDAEAQVKVGITTYDEIFSHFVRVLELVEH